MKHHIQLFGLVILSAFVTIHAAFQSGTGTVTDPYHIANASQLDSIRKFPLAHFVLDKDIDLDVAPYNTGEGWEPIPSIGGAFQGSLNGRGHVIRNLYIDRPTQSGIGFFAKLSGAIIDSLGLIHVSLHGKSDIGAFAAISTNTSVILRSFATGKASALGNLVGGLVGKIDAGSSIQDCYAVMNVRANKIIGGLVGILSKSTIKRCYAAGEVVGMERPTQDGLVGDFWTSVNYGDTVPKVVDSYYNSETSTLPHGKHGVGLTTEKMQAKASFANWDFTGVWSIVEGESYPSLKCLPTQELVIAVINQEPTVATVYGNTVYFEGDGISSMDLQIKDILAGYSFTGWEIDGKVVSTNPVYTLALSGSTKVKATLSKTNADFGGGFGTQRNPYLIKTPQHLDNLRKYVSDTLDWALANDIDLNVAPYNTGEGWTPIPQFVGYLNGRGFAVKNMMIHKPTKDSLGLISLYQSYLGIDSLGILNMDIQGNSNIGGIVGVYGSYRAPIRYSYVSGKIRAQEGNAGGIVGYMDNNGLVQLTAADIDLESVEGSVGGIVGETIYGGSIQQCYSLGRIKTSGPAGGILGFTYYEGNLSDNYSFATVEAGKLLSKDDANYAGGIAGIVSGGDRDTKHFIYVDRNYYIGSSIKIVGLDKGFFNVSPQYNFVGNEVTKTKATYSQWNFDTTWTIQEGTEFPRLQGTYQFTHPVVTALVRNRVAPKVNALGLRRFDLLGRTLF